MTTATAHTSEHLKGRVNFLHHIRYEHLVAGLAGGLTSTLILHPLDVIKIRFAVNDGRSQSAPKYKGISNAFKTIFVKEGGRGLYRGVTPNCWGAATSWGLYFLFYNTIKGFVQNGNTERPLGAITHLSAASQAGVLTLLITNPLWVVKTRLCLQYSYGPPRNTHEYTGMVDALLKIYSKDGFKGYYKGLIPGIFGVSHGAVQFMTYEELKNRYNTSKGNPITTKLTTVEYLSFAAISKLIAAATTYPYQVVRARLQNQHYCYNGVGDCIRQTWIYEGWKGFYKGLGTNLLRVTPATMITFLTYENITYYLLRSKNTM